MSRVVCDLKHVKEFLDSQLKFQRWRFEQKIPTSMHFMKKGFITKVVKEIF